MNAPSPDVVTRAFGQLSAGDFELLKILLDKGALALVVVIVGFVISILLERYKSVLARQHEVMKITAPMTTKMILIRNQPQPP